MEQNETAPTKKKWYSIREAADYLDVGEPTVYRWMREGKITYRKVGDSTRFWQEDLDSVMQVYHSEKDLDTTREVCPVCRHTELAEGKVRGAGLVYFVPKKTKFWTLKDSFVDTRAFMCTRCGAVSWFGDTAKLATLRAQAAQSDAKEPAAESEGE
ncbi:MAG TPA: helix-turn-helix domain-containing protein [Candidatus Paceibacterota bacterium]|nr:helix-turn-helix domain-containing protein [Verrucomicrobiota bacterium]HSA09403.1 helix-turn-helix domain-containing protein [Candidatus Paceibacterota bacterium]